MRLKTPGKSFAREVADHHGYPPSTNEAILLYNASLEYLGDGGHPRDYARSFKLNSKAAELRFPDAILAMGWFYVGGPRSHSRHSFGAALVSSRGTRR